MIYPTKTDLIPFLEHLVAAIQPFAKANFVNLHFKTNLKKLIIIYHPESLLPDLTQLLCRVITFTPQEYDVTLDLQASDGFVLIRVLNTGVELDHLGEIIFGIRRQVIAGKLEHGGSFFELRLPLEEEDLKARQTERWASLARKEYVIPPFYKRLKESLHSHFTNIKNLEKAADARSEREGAFLKKVNAVIIAHLDDDQFDMQRLAKATALSRSQLYRRLKPLIRQSPAHYIKFVRLQKAKEMLDYEDLPIGEIAFRTGFMNQSHFTRAFRELFGFNPSDFKRTKKQEESLEKDEKNGCLPDGKHRLRFADSLT